MIASMKVAILGAAMLAMNLAAAQDKPGPFASSDTKLDYLIASWARQNFETLGRVWGRETSTLTRGENQVYLYERTSRARAGISIFGQATVSTSDIVCTASFEVDNEGAIVRATRRGGGRECWNLFKRYEPPSD